MSVKVGIEHFEIATDHVVYMVRVNIGNLHWTMRKRYSEFYALSGKLKSECSGVKFPSKRRLHMSHKHLDRRRRQLDEYAREVVDVVTSPEGRLLLWCFFGVPQWLSPPSAGVGGKKGGKGGPGAAGVEPMTPRTQHKNETHAFWTRFISGGGGGGGGGDGGAKTPPPRPAAVDAAWDNSTIEYVKHGLPAAMRTAVWELFISRACRQLPMPPAGNPGTYSQLGRLPEELVADTATEVERDIGRTRSGIDTVVLRRVLLAYAQRNPLVGYCQGMNFVVALLLDHVSEKHAFWALVLIVEQVNPATYERDMLGLHTDQRVLAQLLGLRLPQLSRHLKRLGITMPFLSTQWHITLFSTDLPMPVVLRIWDMLLALSATSSPPLVPPFEAAAAAAAAAAAGGGSGGGTGVGGSASGGGVGSGGGGESGGAWGGGVRTRLPSASDPPVLLTGKQRASQ